MKAPSWEILPEKLISLVDESLEFHIEDCMMWEQTWESVIEGELVHLRAEPDNKHKETLKYCRRKQRVLRGKLEELLAVCLWWNEIEAGSKEEAIAKIGKLPLPDDATYVDDSFEILEDEITSVPL